jgi:hypothetical protein
MRFILAGWLAFGLAWLWAWFLRTIGLKECWRLGLAIPCGEELIKVSIAWWFQLWPPIIYLLFGFSEGLYESVIYKKRFDPALILAGIITHFAFGLFFWFKFAGWLSLFLAVIMHLSWNNLIIRKQSDYNRSSK